MNRPFVQSSCENDALLDTLFGDLPIDRWPPLDPSTNGYPWDVFIEARTHLTRGAAGDAKRCWQDIVAYPGLESRHYLQAWHFLREYGDAPASEAAKQVLGVVVEVNLPEGLDVLATYADGSLRYYNHAGGGTVLDEARGPLGERVAALLAAASEVVLQIGPWEGARPGPPAPDYARLSFLTPSGLHFGEGPLDVLEADPVAGPTLGIAAAVVAELAHVA